MDDVRGFTAAYNPIIWMMLEVLCTCTTHHMDDVRGYGGRLCPIIWMMLEDPVRNRLTHHMDDVRGCYDCA